MTGGECQLWVCVFTGGGKRVWRLVGWGGMRGVSASARDVMGLVHLSSSVRVHAVWGAVAFPEA